jgi:hypothetical protein
VCISILTSSCLAFLWLTSIYLCDVHWVWRPSFNSILYRQSTSGNDCGRKGEKRQDRTEVLHNEEVKEVSEAKAYMYE